jgi:hypothetical protein
MKITDEKWNEIISETQAGIARWNARAFHHGIEDTFSCFVERGEKFVVLFTRHTPGEQKAVARELATGELRKATLAKQDKRIRASIRTSDPKSWQKLADKPAAEIVRKLKLLNFVMFVSSRVTSVSTTPPTTPEPAKETV